MAQYIYVSLCESGIYSIGVNLLHWSKFLWESKFTPKIVEPAPSQMEPHLLLFKWNSCSKDSESDFDYQN